MVVQMIRSKVIEGVEPEILKQKLQKVNESDDLNQGVKHVTVLLGQEQGTFLTLIYWESHEAMLQGTPKLNRSPELAALFSDLDASKMELETCEILFDTDVVSSQPGA
jgi:hypothetical protein